MTKFDRDRLTVIDREIVLRIIGGVGEDERAAIDGDPSYGNAATHLVRRIAERNAELRRRK
jgi:hypothetical protein